MAPTLVPDKLDAAIAAAEAPVPMRQIRVNLGPDRFVMLAAPEDLNLAEVLGLVGFLTAGGLAEAMAAMRRSSLEIARVMPT